MTKLTAITKPNNMKSSKKYLPLFLFMSFTFPLFSFAFSFLGFSFTFRSTYYTSLCLAIMRSQTAMLAEKERTFVSSTLHVIKPHSRFCLHNFFAVIKRWQWSVEVHHSASHVSVFFVPLISTNPAPSLVVINLYQSFSGGLPSFHQTSWWIE